ncbi:MAG: rhamnogalacturonan acetylesterase [Gemmatimonadaceae bacterium]|nr:rhamnogalacturonan acetylesterase [Gemmatimonadaceae bacterium]
MSVRRLAVIAAATVALMAATRPQPLPVVHLIGDSTMADKPDPDNNPERGWGQALPALVKPGVRLINYAVNGRSTRSFINEGRWAKVRADLKTGDWLFIQFGHNDQKVEDSARYAAPLTAYRRNLERFVQEARDAGAYPVLFTSIVRRQFNASGTLEDTHGMYPLIVRDVARDLGVPLVDLQWLTEDFVRRAGPVGSIRFYVHTTEGQFPKFPAARTDNTHLSPLGAAEVARLAVEEMKRSGGDIGGLFR